MEWLQLGSARQSQPNLQLRRSLESGPIPPLGRAYLRPSRQLDRLCAVGVPPQRPGCPRAGYYSWAQWGRGATASASKVPNRLTKTRVWGAGRVMAQLWKVDRSG